jgi:Ca-activated chloride channel homolog
VRLAEPAWLLLLLLVPLPWLWQKGRPRISWPSLAFFRYAPTAGAGWVRWLPGTLRGLAIAAMAVALARPQEVGGRTWIAGKGVAIVAAFDRSSSMKAEDFPSEGGNVSRLEAAKGTFARFVEGRPDDLIGLIAFANYPDPACPPTLDHGFLLETVRGLRPARPGEDGTNMGDAIALGLQALEKAPPKRKVLVLLTDGLNRPAVPEPLDPEEGARLARDLGVTLHTIAVGRPGGIVREKEATTGLAIPSEVEGPDLELLGRLARIGGGKSFTASDAEGLAQVFQAIDALEKSPVRGTYHTRYRERFAPWVVFALAALIGDRYLSAGRLRRLP